MFAFMKKSLLSIVMLIAALAAVTPASAGGPSDGFDAYLEIIPSVNGKDLERNSATGKYYVKPGAVLTFAPRFIGGKGDVVSSPVSKLGWDLSVVGAPGVVTPFRGGGRDQKSRSPQYRVHKLGYVYITGSAFSGDANIEFHRTAMETIVVSSAPAPRIALNVTVFVDNNTARVVVGIDTNIRLTNVHMAADSWYGQLRVWMRSDQGVAWKQIALNGMTALEYERASTALDYQDSGGYHHIALPDGIMDSAGLNLPIPVDPESTSHVSFSAKPFRG